MKKVPTKEQLQGMVGGTLVEYLDGHGLDQEWDRATVIHVVVDGTAVSMTTNGKTKWGAADFNDSDYWEVNGVLYICPPMLGFWFALAPAGVTIPKPEERRWRHPAVLALD